MTLCMTAAPASAWYPLTTPATAFEHRHADRLAFCNQKEMAEVTSFSFRLEKAPTHYWIDACIVNIESTLFISYLLQQCLLQYFREVDSLFLCLFIQPIRYRTIFLYRSVFHSISVCSKVHVNIR